ncbi:hypothetical protein FF011L_12220 [Roseimaritima multifibrata]|uniref:Inner membrane protein (DUF1819) n=1 Tax=Roseimaritima multifibrata TaxID=1930274 RepID=A0A517MC63_9BACT|nr:DUF1819 family protein [Roseimaritima multifibrata]QDS92479.1 hypothetical protein FF011L_12220 [Roseimaritima multifibrata]
MIENRYVLSFSAGGLLYHESIVVAEVYASVRGDWQHVVDEIAEGNLLQSRTVSTTQRKLREVRKRLEHLTAREMALLASGSRLDQKLLLWLACCLRYQALADFAREVLRAKYLQLDLFIAAADVSCFLDAKSAWHDEIENLADSTRTKLQSVMMRMLRESEMVTADGIILPPLMSQEVQSVILEDSRDHFQFFPVAIPQ